MKRILILLFLISLFIGCLQQSPPACTADAKVCPDGSAVGRIPTDCEFAPCPPVENCTFYPVDQCPEPCVVCPPCEVCSSVVCQSEEFCAGMGFDREWYRSVTTSRPP